MVLPQWQLPLPRNLLEQWAIAPILPRQFVTIWIVLQYFSEIE
ncbi:hypothetical protein [Synechococcus sp. PCC 7336]|nr:hypothetical protein [Synechococcus sp. PCC 7336]